jgi:hypothetical protein
MFQSKHDHKIIEKARSIERRVRGAKRKIAKWGRELRCQSQLGPRDLLEAMPHGNQGISHDNIVYASH